MIIDHWFPTTIYGELLPNATELNKHLLKHIKQWRQKDKKGVSKTNRKGWHSETDMHLKQEYEPLTKEILFRSKISLIFAPSAKTLILNFFIFNNIIYCFI